MHGVDKWVEVRAAYAAGKKISSHPPSTAV
jgi:hypothetical protein